MAKKRALSRKLRSAKPSSLLGFGLARVAAGVSCVGLSLCEFSFLGTVGEGGVEENGLSSKIEPTEHVSNIQLNLCQLEEK